MTKAAMTQAMRFLHELPDFQQLLAVVSRQRGIDPVLVEKDYWLMHCLWGLQQRGFAFELKGGTSLSKGFGLIDRFSEDIDLRIEPPAYLKVKTGVNHDKPAHIESRRQYYEWLRANLQIKGIDSVERDTAFDDDKLRSAGLRLNYASQQSGLAGVKTGILLELGFDTTAPNRAVTVSAWAWDAAMTTQPALQALVFDNRAKDVLCYLPGYTLVEKLQTISTKYRRYVLDHEDDGRGS
jgi:Nucleotidyl transferase AbiEii toxin, Type IV TA system